MEHQLSLLLAYSVFDILLKKIKSPTQNVENSDEYTKILSELLQVNINFEVYQKLSSDNRGKIARMLAKTLFGCMYSYETTYSYKLMSSGELKRSFKNQGPQYNRGIDGADTEIYSITFPPGLFGNNDVLLRELMDVINAINIYLNFPQQELFLAGSFFQKLPAEIFHMTTSYYMEQDITTLKLK